MTVSIAIGSLSSRVDGAPAFARTIKALAAERLTAELIAFVPRGDEQRLAVCEGVADLRVVSRDLATFSQRRNALIGEATGDLIVFIDEGCIPAPNWLFALEAAFEDPAVGAVEFALYDSVGDTQPGSTPELYSGVCPYLPLAASAVRRSSLVVAGAYDEAIVEPSLSQLDFCGRLIEAGFQSGRLDGAVFSAPPIPESIPVTSNWRAWYEDWISINLSSSSRSFRSSLRAALRILDSTADRISVFGTNPAFFPTYAADTDAAIDSALRKRLTPWRRVYYPEARHPRSPPVSPPPALVQRRGRPLIICMLSQEYPPGVVGGVGRMTAELARGFVREGHCVHVITRLLPDSPSIRFEDGIFVHGVTPLPYGGPPAGVRMPEHLWRYSRAAADRVNWIAGRNRIDLVDAPLWDAEGLAVILDGKWTCVTNLETPLRVMLDLNPEWLDDENNRSMMEALLAAEKSAMLESHGIRAISAAILRTIESGYEVDLSGLCHAVVPIGIRDEPAPPLEHPENVTEILFAGRFERRKGIDVLLEAIPSLCREFPFLRFTLAGRDREIVLADGSRRTTVFESAHANDPIRGQVSFVGAVSDDELARLYRRCDIFVAPSLYESFGIVYLEAMRAGKPVIGCRVGGIPEVVEHGVTGLLCEPSDASGLRSAIAALANDPARRTRMGQAGRARFERNFTIEKTIHRTIEFYRSVLSNRASLARSPRE